ncbi:MAG TPA: methylmalonyl Co-A mutase-associated GTPase MeaB [Negativicutes bacterium]|nr:methylmalonyl Co-A mutase-associated GTPase MeaB [Negativicutes bacterium]
MKGRQGERQPEWACGDADAGYASKVLEGVATVHDGMPGQEGRVLSVAPVPAPSRLGVQDYVQGVLNGDRSVLARAITLVESNNPGHAAMAQALLQELSPHTGGALRIGITGVPGAGKSTFIETLGCRLCRDGHKIAVLAVDPSSTVTRGSILGDKTRMEQLSRQPAAFIRPSPSGGTLGGVARKSRETLLLCEAASYDVILVETVGVGQSEVTVRSMVDCFLLIVLTGAGDELQGMKKGIMELADLIAVNKADGDNRPRALAARADFERMLHYLRPATDGWRTPALTCSAFTGEGVGELWGAVEDFFAQVKSSGVFDARRKNQVLAWMRAMVMEHLQQRFFDHPEVRTLLPRLEQAVAAGSLVTTRAVQELLQAYEGQKGR